MDINRGKLHFDKKALMCPLKRFISYFYSQIFIENLNFSKNVEIGEDFSRFVIEFLDKYDVRRDR